ncbi:riboflavin biosynthesis protein RibF [Dehalogenimonas lykanthroporepellens BL-DC-9]|nr:riboflavin biosynthesis protein RibF [Dehalogenimonas lykanthroporepellens BL-DC-9]
MTHLLKEFELAGRNQPTALTIGVFDGVHLGHQALLTETVRQATRSGLTPAAVTFTGHPRLVLGRHSELPHLTSLNQRLCLLRECGINHVATLTFSPELAELSASDFISLLLEYLSLRHLIIGPDFALGRDRAGDADYLHRLSRAKEFDLTIIPPVIIDGERVSSTLIRRAMADSDMPRVRKLLGRCFALEGRVIHGEGRGARLDIPTANLELEADQALPADGVYASRTTIGNVTYASITNIGTRPTFGTGRRTVETHIMNFNGDLYDRGLEVAIIEQIRPELKFDSPDALKKQIQSDITQAGHILAKAEC